MNNNNRPGRRLWRGDSGGGLQPSEDLVAEAVHELRAPLGGIDAMARMLAETGLTDAQRRLVDGLMAASGHLRRVADDVLDDAALGRGALALRIEPFNLSALLSSVAVAAEARAAAKGLAFRMVLDPAMPTHVAADAARIRQMLENLIDNAVKVTSAGSVELDVAIAQSRVLRMMVRDTGPGVDADAAARIFAPFNRASTNAPGTGLGLSIVRKLARLMGGDAGVEGAPGRGSAFWFTAVVETAAPAPDAGHAGMADHAAGAGVSLQVLVVDDNAANRQIMEAMLTHFGHRCVMAETGEDALRLLSRHSFDAVMLDQSLPGLSGLDVLRAIRASAAPISAIPVVAVTGHVTRKDREAFHDAGATGFVAKPFAARDIRDALAAIVQG